MIKRRFNNAMLVLLTTAVLFNALLLNVSPTLAEEEGTPWPMYQHDASHSGTSPSTAPLTEAIFWKHDVGVTPLTCSTTGGPTGSPGAPAIAGGKVYEGRLDNKTYCLDEATGNVLWTFEANGPIYGTPAIADGKVYIGSTFPDNKTYCLDAENGTLIWSYSAGGSIWGSPTVVEGKVYFGSLDRNVYCLDAATGSWIWNYTAGLSVYTTPAVVDGKVYVGSSDGNVYCLDAATGSKVWSFTTDGWVRASPTVADGKVYVASYYPGKSLYCLSAADGSIIWGPKLQEATMFSTPVVAAGKVYIAIFYYNLVKAFDAATGDLVWTWSQEEGVLSMGTAIESDIAYAQGNIYFGSFDKHLYCLDAGGGTKMWSYESGGCMHSPSIADGLVIVGSDDGNIYAFGTFVPRGGGPEEKKIRELENQFILLNATAQKIIKDMETIENSMGELYGALNGLTILTIIMLTVIPIVIIAFYHKITPKKVE